MLSSDNKNYILPLWYYQDMKNIISKAQKHKFQRFIKRNFREVIAIYLYGSRVKGYANSKSDTDAAVVVEDKNKVKDTLDFMNQIASHLKVREPDVRVVDKDSSSAFLFQVIKEGKLLYERTREERENFEVQVLLSFFDTSRIRQIYREYLYKQIKEDAYGYQ